MPPTGDVPIASRSPSCQSAASSASSQPLPVVTCDTTSSPTTPSFFNCANVSRACDANCSSMEVQAIAEGLMADGVPTARGKPGWYAATIYAVVTSDSVAALA
jgi:hypothetical protein